MDFTDVKFKKQDNNKITDLKAIERQFGWHAEDWHFTLLHSLSPQQVYSFFRDAVFKNKKIYFDGSTESGRLAYSIAGERHANDLFNALGNTTIVLAKDGKIIRDRRIFFNKNGEDGYLARDEINFMFDVCKRAMNGEKFDSVNLLSNYRQQRHDFKTTQQGQKNDQGIA